MSSPKGDTPISTICRQIMMRRLTARQEAGSSVYVLRFSHSDEASIDKTGSAISIDRDLPYPMTMICHAKCKPISPPPITPDLAPSSPTDV